MRSSFRNLHRRFEYKAPLSLRGGFQRHKKPEQTIILTVINNKRNTFVSSSIIKHKENPLNPFTILLWEGLVADSVGCSARVGVSFAGSSRVA